MIHFLRENDEAFLIEAHQKDFFQISLLIPGAQKSGEYIKVNKEEIVKIYLEKE